MATYRNTSNVTKTFYGVEFEPGSVHTVPGPINDSKLVRLPDEVKPTVIEDKPGNVGKKATEKSTTKSKQTGGNEDG